MVIKKEFLEGKKEWNVWLYDEIDIYNATELKQELEQAIIGNPADMVVDCQDLSYMDSTGLGVLVSSLKKLKEHGCSIKLKNLKSHIYKIFELTDLNKLFVFEGENK